MSIPLLCVMALCWLVVLRKHGPISFVFAGVFCFSAYSIPALVGLVLPFDPGVAHLATSSRGAVNVTTLAWTVFLLTIMIPAGSHGIRWIVAPLGVPGNPSDLRAFIIVALAVCVAGFMVIASRDGLFFFLAPRNEQSESAIHLVWRWANAIGLVAAVSARSWRAASVLLAGVLVYFFAGDRTVVAITAFCALIVWGQGRSFRDMCRGLPLLAMALSLIMVVFGKIIYIAAKIGSLELIVGAFSAEYVQAIMTTFEPFTTFSILDVVVSREFSMDLGMLVKGVLGQLLLIPSAFGIDSNSFNTEFTNRFTSHLNYGIAGNFWAQAWAVAGPLGVGVYAVIYGVSLRMLDSSFRRYSGVPRVLFAFLGALMAVYAHRNSLENLLSFVRQILMVTSAVAAIAYCIDPYCRVRNGDFIRRCVPPG